MLADKEDEKEGGSLLLGRTCSNTSPRLTTTLMDGQAAYLDTAVEEV